MGKLLDRTADRHGRDIPLSTSAQKLIQSSQEARRNARLRISGVSAGVMIIVAATSIFAWQQWNNQRFAEIIRDTSLNRARPELLPISKSLQKEAESLAVNGNIDGALSNYRVILSYAHLLENKAKDVSINLEEIRQLKTSAELALVIIIHDYRLPELEKELQARRWGKLISEGAEGVDYKKYENRYEKGALRVTYKILMQDYGAGADLDKDGLINYQDEADRLPCRTLRDIEDLWRKYTENRCDWQGLNYHIASKCRELKGQTLTINLFPQDEDFVIERIKSCKKESEATQSGK